MKKSKFVLSLMAAALFATSAAGLSACSKGGTNDNKPNDGGGKTYTITLDPNGGTLVGASTVTTGTDGKLSIIPAAPTPSGERTFNGWWTLASGGSQVTTSTVFSSNGTIWAHWTQNGGGGGGGGEENPTGVYTVTFHENGGTFETGETGTRQTAEGVLVGGAPTVTPPTGQQLTGWFTAETGGTQINFATHTFTEDTDVYAQYGNGSQITTGSGLYVGGTMVGELVEHADADLSDGKTVEYYLKSQRDSDTGVQLASGAVVTIKIDGVDIDYYIDGGYGINKAVTGKQTSVTTTAAGTFKFYVKHYPDRTQNTPPGDPECWTVYATDGTEPLPVVTSTMITFSDATITVAFNKPGWAASDVRLYVFADETKLNGDWPGNAMTSTLNLSTQSKANVKFIINFDGDDGNVKQSVDIDASTLTDGATYTYSIDDGAWDGNTFGVHVA